jgi:hypothetical protein
MTVRKTLARLLDANGTLIGEGRAYIHLRLPDGEPQNAQGTLSLDWWNEVSSGGQVRLELVGGPTVSLTLESDTLSGCMNGRILRYTTSWPGTKSAFQD